ncbi:IS3 family transposase [Bradyrhizobium archetypum]|uniref:IS3 family transposase n=1 Tax=Bradyrhizobium archetypum TaxID=2721160 RepID=UPI0040630763
MRRWVDKFRQEPASAAWRPTTQATPMSADQASEIARLRQENRTAAHGARHFKKVDRDLRRNPDMSFRFIEDHRDAYPVRLMCAVLEVSPAGYYAWRERRASERTKSNATLLAAIRQACRDSSGRCGSPRVHAVLRTQGRGASRGRIERMMRRHGIRAIMALPRRVRTTDSRHDLPIAPNLIARDFTAPAPNRVWLADITYIPTAEGWLYLAAVMDLFSRKIVGWAMRDHMQVELASAALTMAIQQQRPQAGLIHHSDRGVQYASHAYRDALSGAGITASMSRKADCYDNAPMESFFHTLKAELISLQLHHARRGPARYLRLHRGLLQPNPPPFRNRIYRPDRDGAKSCLTCPLFSGEDQIVSSGEALPSLATLQELFVLSWISEVVRMRGEGMTFATSLN